MNTNFDQRRIEDLRGEFRPNTPHEETLIRSMAHARWRMDVYEQLETSAFQMLMTGAMDSNNPHFNLLLEMRRGKTSVLIQVRRMYDKAEQSYKSSYRMLIQARKAPPK